MGSFLSEGRLAIRITVELDLRLLDQHLLNEAVPSSAMILAAG
jgi:hypothetical protein